MKNKKNRKHLIMASVAMLICVGLIVGGTLSLFTAQKDGTGDLNFEFGDVAIKTVATLSGGPVLLYPGSPLYTTDDSKGTVENTGTGDIYLAIDFEYEIGEFVETSGKLVFNPKGTNQNLHALPEDPSIDMIAVLFDYLETNDFTDNATTTEFYKDPSTSRYYYTGAGFTSEGDMTKLAILGSGDTVEIDLSAATLPYYAYYDENADISNDEPVFWYATLGEEEDGSEKKEVFNYLFDDKLGISFTMTAYAIQAENLAGAKVDDFNTYFAAQTWTPVNNNNIGTPGSPILPHIIP